MTKVLIHGNGPNVSTGYGVQCAQLAERLKQAGHDVAVSSTYGTQGSTASWRGITLYPTGYEQNGNDVIHMHAMHHFGGDPLAGWIIPILDVWALKNPVLADFQVAAWCPVDHFPVPKDVLAFFHRTGAVPIAMSRFGERLLFDAGLDPVYVPLAVDTKVMRPTPHLEVGDRRISARELLDLPADAFVVGMVAMNKGWSRDRKGFNEAFRAFGQFWKRHPNAVLYMHAEQFGGAEGINLVELAQHASIPPHAIRWVDQYGYRLGIPAEMMAATYSAMDVLLAPSHGEGFCVPLIEAQACGTPVIATDFSAQSELIGSGWALLGQPEWDPAQSASYVCPLIDDVVAKLEEAYRADLASMIGPAVEFAARYDADVVFDTFWRPFLDSLEPQEAEKPPYEREPIPEDSGAVAVIVPAMRRPENVARLVESLVETTPGDTIMGQADVYFVCDKDDQTEIAAIKQASADLRVPYGRLQIILSDRGSTYAEKANCGFEHTSSPWVFLCGDDVEFTPGWLDEARKLSDRFDVIGTNDTAEGIKNPDVASGRHSDHSLFRRAYVDTCGAALDGPGVLASEAYGHWFVDKEQVGLAKARGVFTPCLTSVVEHHHPGFEGKERDEVYVLAQERAEADQRTFRSRLPLIEMQRVSRAKAR